MRSFVLVVVTVAAIAPAAAQPATPASPGSSVAMADPTPTLQWNAPPGCPDAADLRARIERRLERSLDDVVLGIEVDVAQKGSRYIARVDLRAMTVANDVRTLTSTHCDEIADAVAVIVTRVASDAIARKRTAVREQDVNEKIIVEPEPRPTPRMWSVGGRLGAVSGIGVIPKVGVAAELAITVRRDELMVEVAGTRWLDSYAQFHDGAPAVVNVFLDTAATRVGWRPARLPLRAWAAIEFGMMDGNSTKLPGEQFDSGRWIAAGAGFGVAWQITKWLRLVGSNETMLAIDRMRFRTGDGLVVYAPAPMSFRASAGIEVGWQ
ncbi:MAG TPA: hypothetical protein VFV99_05845 [Kofleriaceae bacterium]|nr:hypothetical protein [Kofleriaceae bacterium]